MEYNVKKYLDDKTIIINKYITYPQDFRNIIDENIELVKNYFLEKAHIDEIKRNHSKPNYTFLTNKFNEQFNKLLNNLKETLIEFEILAFHATNLFIEEYEDIKKNGFKLFNKENYNKKLSILKKYNFTKNEIHILIENSETEDTYRENLIFFCPDLNHINKKDTMLEYLYNWGGEITYFNIRDSDLMQKINRYTLPYLIITKIKFNIKDDDIYKKLLYDNFISTNKNPPGFSDRNISDLSEVKMLDIIKFDKKNGDRLTF